MKRVDHSGKRFGKLLVIEKLQQRPYEKARYRCKCDCGNETIVTGSNLVTGCVCSCGCVIKKHGLSHKERLYNIWVGMKQRCRDVNSPDYERYGGRGIAVCNEWKDDYLKFREWAMSNGYKDTLTIDRIDNDGNYCPDNCRWITVATQNNNTSQNTYITHNNKTRNLSEWAKILGINYKTLRSRLYRGWSFERIAATRRWVN